MAHTTFNALCSVLPQDMAWTILNKLGSDSAISTFLENREWDDVFQKHVQVDGIWYRITTYSLDCGKNVLHFGVWNQYCWLTDYWFPRKMRIWRSNDYCDSLCDITVAIGSKMAL